MKFRDLYNMGITLWPSEINIGDGYPTSKTGYMFPELTAIHNEIEDSLDVNDDWLQIIDWSLFQAFHSESKNLLKNKEQTLFTHKVKMSEIQSRVIKNLNSEGWESLLAEYENDL